MLNSMRSIHFDMQGFSRTYQDLFLAAGFSVDVFFLFSAILRGSSAVFRQRLWGACAALRALSLSALPLSLW